MLRTLTTPQIRPFSRYKRESRIFLLYFPLLEGRFGQTLGKRLLGMHVLNENGMHIGYKQAFLRRISFYFDIFPFDALFVLFTEKRQRGFDIIARTVVVNEN